MNDHHHIHATVKSLTFKNFNMIIWPKMFKTSKDIKTKFTKISHMNNYHLHLLDHNIGSKLEKLNQ